MDFIILTFIIIFVNYVYKRYQWYKTVLNNNPTYASIIPVLTNKKSNKVTRNPIGKVQSPKCTFRQYLKYLRLACLPYVWSVPVKFLKQIYFRSCKRMSTEYEKRQRLGKMVLETSLVLGFREREDNFYYFRYKNFRIPSKMNPDCSFHIVNDCQVLVKIDGNNNAVFENILVNGEELTSLNQIMSFLNTLWCVYTHTLTHVMAGNVAELNLESVRQRSDLTEEFRSSIDNMHATVSGMNESANHYPADIWGIPRKQLQIILGYNSVQQIENHQNIIHCRQVSDFVNFTLKARKIYTKYLGGTGLSISTLSANTIFHSIDHYNMGKYFLQDKEEKSFLGIDSRMITSLLGDLNFDIFRWQSMKYAKCSTWRQIYEELYQIDEELANKVHMFVSV